MFGTTDRSAVGSDSLIRDRTASLTVSTLSAASRPVARASKRRRAQLTMARETGAGQFQYSLMHDLRLATVHPSQFEPPHHDVPWRQTGQ